MLTLAATDPVWYGCVLSLHWAKYNLAEPIPLHVEHVAVEVVEPFRPSGPCLRTMKTSGTVLAPAFSPITGRLVGAGASSFPYRSKGPAHCPDHMSSLSSIPGTRGFRIGVVLLLDRLPTKAAEPQSTQGSVVVQKEPFFLSPRSLRSLGEVPNLTSMSVA